MQKEIQLIYFNAGGGHRSAALALKEVIEAKHSDWNVSLINLFEVIDTERNFQKLTGFAPEDLYNLRLKKGWTLGLATELKVLQAIIRFSHAKIKRKLQPYWRLTRPSMVVSLVPNFNKVMWDALHQECPNVPYVTVMTDIADHPPHFWIEEGQDQHLICGSARAMAQAQAAGYQNHQLTQTSGMILRPGFYQTARVDKESMCAELGLDPTKPTGLVMFGGNGSNQMLRIAKDLSDTQLILVCGHNVTLARNIEVLKAPAKHVVLGFTSDVDRFMSLCDFFIGKPGPGSLSEAIHMGLPVITFKNSLTMPQERYNATWVKENHLGIVVTSVGEMKTAARELLARLPAFKEAVGRIENRAVFEVVTTLEKIIDASQAA
ncbi:MAG: Processive diacylglycerol beta-glucosyltransferase [Pseudomonadota bacterium]|jgi:UDP-N-acetylglucosamine:LPS N-acetylglucosamine transferase